jgi:hypothetical protein
MLIYVDLDLIPLQQAEEFFHCPLSIAGFDVVSMPANLRVRPSCQVIGATSMRRAGEGLPEIDYHSGSLENTEIRGLVYVGARVSRHAFASYSGAM